MDLPANWLKKDTDNLFMLVGSNLEQARSYPYRNRKIREGIDFLITFTNFWSAAQRTAVGSRSGKGPVLHYACEKDASGIFLLRRGVRISLEQFTRYCDLDWGKLKVLTDRGDRLNTMLTSLAKR